MNNTNERANVTISFTFDLLDFFNKRGWGEGLYDWYGLLLREAVIQRLNRCFVEEELPVNAGETGRGHTQCGIGLVVTNQYIADAYWEDGKAKLAVDIKGAEMQTLIAKIEVILTRTNAELVGMINRGVMPQHEELSTWCQDD